MTSAVAEMWGWPVWAFGALGCYGATAAAATKPVTRDVLPQLPAPAGSRYAIEAAPVPAFTEAARELLRRVSLSLTAISTRAQAYFAQLAAALAYDRALRDAKRAQEAFEATFRPAPAQKVAASWDDIPFMSTITMWWQAAAAVASLWRTIPAPFAFALPSGFASGGQPGLQNRAAAAMPVWPWEAFAVPARSTPWQTITVGLPGLAFGFAWDPAAFRQFGVQR